LKGKTKGGAGPKGAHTCILHRPGRNSYGESKALGGVGVKGGKGSLAFKSNVD